MDLVSTVVFLGVQITSAPLAVIAVSLILCRLFYGYLKHGVSVSAGIIINSRWTMDIFGLKKDPASVKLNKTLPYSSIPMMWLLLFPSYLRYLISGKNKGYPSRCPPGFEGLFDMVISRTFLIDAIIRGSIGGVEQFVVLGAGFDTRCFGDLADLGLRFFELDRPETQRHKLRYLRKAGLDISKVKFIGVDFCTENWFIKLQQAGYDRSKKTIFLWEGVTLYLSEDAIRKTMRDISGNSAPGSSVIADFYSSAFVQGRYRKGMGFIVKTLPLIQEEFLFGLDFSSSPHDVLKDFIESMEAELGKYGLLGSRTRKGTFLAVAEIRL